MNRATGLALFAVALCGCAQTDGTRWTPLQLALFTPVQMVPESWDVHGVKVNLLFGRNRNVYGIDAGIFNRANGQGAGLQFGPLNSAHAFRGLQLGAVSFTEDMVGLQTGWIGVGGGFARRLRGVQIAGVSYAGNMDGAQLGIGANQAGEMRGLQLALLMNEVRPFDARGVQVSGIANWNGGRTSGLQVGLVNRARSLSGVQIGLININKEGALPFFPLINIGFGAKEVPPKQPVKTEAANLFMVFGEPDIEIERDGDGRYVAEIKGLDIYDPTTGMVRSNSTDDIACWFIDTNYNGESFFVRHAYFCGGDEPYDKLKRALRAEIDEAAWSSLYSTRSRPFPKPDTNRIAIKVINHYGDEVVKVYEVG